MRKTFPLTRKQFGLYIKAKSGKGFRRGDDYRCPITMALRATQPKAKGGEPVTVGGYEILPSWATRFMSYYDGNEIDEITGNDLKPLSAYDAAVKVGAIRA